MTDNDIIKALECCKDRRCDICVRLDSGHNEECICRLELIDHALDLINRQKAEIERLTDKVARLKESVRLMLNYDDGDERIKSEAIKEFAERLKDYLKEHAWIWCSEVDNLVKEMTEDKNG